MDEMTPLQIIEQTYSELLPGKYAGPEATAMLLAIGHQESRFAHRQQVGGPARGFWQFEAKGGVLGVLRHGSSQRQAEAVCLLRNVKPLVPAVYTALLTDDLLACAFARLLLFTDPKPLPALGDEAGSWAYYLRNWRPGKPHEKTWAKLYASALEQTTGGARERMNA